MNLFNIKAAVYVVALLAVLIAAKMGVSAIYKSGWNAAIVEQERLIQQAKEDARAKEKEFWESVVADAEAQIIVEEKIVEKLVEVEKKIPVVVDRIVEVKPECRDLGPDFIGLLNEQIRASTSGEAGSTGASSGSNP